MSLGDQKEVLLDTFPTLTKKLLDESKLEELRKKILRLLERRLKKTSIQLKKKIEKIDSEKNLDLLFDKRLSQKIFKNLKPN